MNFFEIRLVGCSDLKHSQISEILIGDDAINTYDMSISGEIGMASYRPIDEDGETIETDSDYIGRRYRQVKEPDKAIIKMAESLAIDMHKQTRLMQELIMTLEKMRKGQK